MWFDEDDDRGDWCAPAPRSPQKILEDTVREWVEGYPSDDFRVGVKGKCRAGTDTPFAVCEDHRLGWLCILGAEDAPKAMVRRRVLALRRPVDQGSEGRKVPFDANKEERDEWVDWARRRHPEWGKNPHTPRRLAPRWETRVEGARKPHGAGLIVLVVHQDYQDWATFEMDGYGIPFDHAYIAHTEGDVSWEVYRMRATSHEGWILESDKWVELETPAHWQIVCGDLSKKSDLSKRELLGRVSEAALR